MIRRAWYERWEFLLLVAVLSTAPLLWPEVPPLVDLPGHLGRYRVELDHGSSALDRYFSFHWSLVGNLGVDLLIVPIAAAFGLEMGIKLIALLIPLLTVLGIFWTSREIHGRIPPTTIFAVPLVYGFPFNYGFLNFCLSMALALNAFALWLWLGRTSRARYRIPLFAPVA